MSKQSELLGQYVSDMLALEQHILEAAKRQINHGNVDDYPQASALFEKMERVLTEHVNHFQDYQKNFEGNGAVSAVKQGVATMAGVIAGLYNELRSDDPARMLRDDYTALSMAAISYTMLHTSAVSFNDNQTAEIALKHLLDLTPLIVEISEIMPMVVGQQLVENGYASTNAGPQSQEMTQRAWKPEIVS